MTTSRSHIWETTREIVADEHIGEAALVAKVHQEVEDLGLDRDVERGGRLVEEENLRFQDQRAGDGDALALAARELVRVAVAEARPQADRVEHVADALPRAVEALDRQRLGELGHDGLARVEGSVGILKHHLDPAVEVAPALARHRLARQPDHAVIGGVEPGKRAQDRRFAAAGFADDAEALALLDLEADVIDDRRHGRIEGDGQIVRLDHDAAPAGGAPQDSSRTTTGRRLRRRRIDGREARRPRV